MMTCMELTGSAIALVTMAFFPLTLIRKETGRENSNMRPVRSCAAIISAMLLTMGLPVSTTAAIATWVLFPDSLAMMFNPAAALAMAIMALIWRLNLKSKYHLITEVLTGGWTVLSIASYALLVG